MKSNYVTPLCEQVLLWNESHWVGRPTRGKSERGYKTEKRRTGSQRSRRERDKQLPVIVTHSWQEFRRCPMPCCTAHRPSHNPGVVGAFRQAHHRHSDHAQPENDRPVAAAPTDPPIEPPVNSYPQASSSESNHCWEHRPESDSHGGSGGSCAQGSPAARSSESAGGAKSLAARRAIQYAIFSWSIQGGRCFLPRHSPEESARPPPGGGGATARPASPPRPQRRPS